MSDPLDAGSFAAPATTSSTLRACSRPNGCCATLTRSRRVHSYAGLLLPTRLRMSRAIVSDSAAVVSGFSSVAKPRKTLPSFIAWSRSTCATALVASGKCRATAANARSNAPSRAAAGPSFSFTLLEFWRSARYSLTSACAAAFARSMKLSAWRVRVHLAQRLQPEEGAALRGDARREEIRENGLHDVVADVRLRAPLEQGGRNPVEPLRLRSRGLDVREPRDVRMCGYTPPRRLRTRCRTLAFLSSTRSPTAWRSAASTICGDDSATSHTAATAARAHLLVVVQGVVLEVPGELFVGRRADRRRRGDAREPRRPPRRISARISADLSPNLRKNCER